MIKSIPEVHGTIAAIKTVINPRYLATERGYQGAFYCALRSSLEQMGILSEKCILEMEYQKSAKHGISQRPDIVFHIPTEISRASVRKNNFAVWALKLNASTTDARDDFDKLDEMCGELRYSLAIFVNIASSTTHLKLYRGKYHERIHAFSFLDREGSQIQHSYFENGGIENVWIDP
jgi:hypothetical protein